MKVRRVLALACATIVALVGLPAGAVAHSPTPTWRNAFDAGAEATYKFKTWRQQNANGVWQDYDFPESKRKVFSPVIERDWSDPKTNNANGPTFTRIESGRADVLVYWAPDNPVHQTNGWLGSADTRFAQREIWLRSNVRYVYRDWCETNEVDRCPMLARASIHEIGHVGSLGHNPSDSWLNTRMHGCLGTSCSSRLYPFKATTSWNTSTIGSCDEAALQLRYDVRDRGGPYADCLDHLDKSGPDGLVTELSVTQASTTACANQVVVISGRLNVLDEAAYGRLRGNGLSERSLRIDRVDPDQRFHQVATSAGGGDNWSLSFTGSNVTFRYVVRWDAPASEGLQSPPRRAFTIRWLSPHVLC